MYMFLGDIGLQILRSEGRILALSRIRWRYLVIHNIEESNSTTEKDEQGEEQDDDLTMETGLTSGTGGPLLRLTGAGKMCEASLIEQQGGYYAHHLSKPCYIGFCSELVVHVKNKYGEDIPATSSVRPNVYLASN
jgi:hypothetical protein